MLLFSTGLSSGIRDCGFRIVPGDKVVLEPEKFTECSDDFSSGFVFQRQSQHGLEQNVRQESHQRVHLDERNVDFVISGRRRVDLSDHIEIRNQLLIARSSNHRGEVSREMFFAKLNLWVPCRY